jgi:hypothetical protein
MEQPNFHLVFTTSKIIPELSTMHFLSHLLDKANIKADTDIIQLATHISDTNS